MGLLKKLKRPDTKEGELASLWDALDQTDNQTKAYAIYGIVEADKDNKLEATILLNFLEMIFIMKEEIPIRDDIVELISSKIMDMGDDVLPELLQMQKEKPKCKVVLNKLIYYINSSKKIDEFEDVMKRMAK